jgi:hypothetical protein
VKEFNLRNKATRPIMTLTAPMLAKMLSARPESVSLVLAKKRQDYKTLTGKALSLDYDQELKLLAHAGADARGTWTSRYNELPHPLNMLRPVFSDGFMQRSMSGSMIEDLALAETFFALLDLRLPPIESSSGQ